jgi:DNA-binding IclR family transcriptional regulator
MSVMPQRGDNRMAAKGRTRAAVLAGPAANKDGTQAIRRATAILKAIARATPHGASLAEISKSEGLPRSTAHRMLKCLMDEGLVDHPDGSLRYQMGALVYELGLAAPRTALEVARWRDAVDAVARRTGVTSYLMRRTGMEAVCLVKAEGHS